MNYIPSLPHLPSGDVPADECLEEPSLFPIKPGDWPDLAQLPALRRPKIIGRRAYDLFVNHRSRRPVVAVIRKMMAEFQSDFEEASCIFEPSHWRQLYYMDLFPLATLGQPDFDGHQIFRRIIDQDPWATEVPASWIGSTERFDESIQEIRVRIADASPDQLKTVWAILAFVRSLSFEKNDVLQAPWWTTWWIETYLCAVATSD